LSVHDTGHGIPASILPRIFEPFFTTKEQGKGTGMGLAVVHGIIKSHGGYISVETAPNKGSSFHLFLPLNAASLMSKGSSTFPITPMIGADKRVLLVDDEAMVVELFGFNVEGSTNSVDALTRFRDAPDRFDVIVTDYTMPVFTGIELARRILEIRPITPIIICTGYSEKESEAQAKSIGIREYLLKPVTYTDLAKCIMGCLGGVQHRYEKPVSDEDL
jgi:CheY-like chemotaxis protein